ncbi:MAG: hypothetical protein U0641_16970 [Anaerolineae bacterium]
MRQQLARAFQISQWVGVGMGASLTLLWSVFSNYLSGEGSRWIPWIVLVTVGFVIAFVWQSLRQPTTVRLILKPVKTLKSEAEKEAVARTGVIAFVSLYNPGQDSSALALSPEVRREAVQRKDYEPLDLQHSTLGSTIEAILTHASRVEHCWLIATRASRDENAGSHIYVPVLEAYLNAQLHGQCKVHCGKIYDVLLDDDAEVFTRTLAAMKRCFEEAQRLGIPPSDLVCDLTAGFRSMTLGMVLSCLNGDQDLQMIGTHYKPNGQVDYSQTFPIIFAFEPVLERVS